MTLREFLNKHITANLTVKVLWPERCKTITGKPADFRNEVRLLETLIFDFQVSNGLTGYHCLIWVTSDPDNILLDL